MRAWHLLGAAILALAACGPGTSSPTPLPTVVLDAGTSSTSGPVAQVTASARVVPAHEAHLAFAAPGLVKAVPVEIGDSVRAGQVVMELDGTTAQLELDSAERALREMTSAAAIAAADQAVASAQQAQDTAQKKVNALSYPRASEAFIDNLRGQITLARQELADATRAFNHVEDLADNDPKKAGPLVRMTNAQINLNKLLGQYNWYTGQPSEIDVALIKANLDAATAAVQEAQWYAAALRGEPIPEQASGAQLASLEAARDAVTAATASLDATRLVSPIDGQVVALELAPGEFATPGQPVAIISDVDHLRVETTDLGERDVPSIEIGQAATAFVEALGEEVRGTVIGVAPAADLLGGDVVYTVTVELDSPPAGLRSGMSAEVTFEVGP